MNAPIRVMLVEDQIPILRAQRQLLQNAPEIEVVAAACSGEEALELFEEARPQVLLCDLGLPGIDGVEVTRRVRARMPTAEVLIFTVFDEEERVLAAIRAGAAGYLLKGIGVAKLVEAILEVHAGGTVIQPRLARLLLRHFNGSQPEADVSPSQNSGLSRGAAWKQADAPMLSPPLPSLSPREVEILGVIARGLTNAEAAGVLGISRSTIRTHLEHIYDKLEVTNRVEAVTEGLRHGLIET